MPDPSRRPLKSRDTAIARHVARWLAGTEITPNQISVGAIVFATLAGSAFWLSGTLEDPWRSLALIVAVIAIQLRLVCNLLDGMVAIEGGKQAPDGMFWNEAPDRAADILILAGMGLGAGVPELGWAAATFSVLTAYIRELGTTTGQAEDFCGPMAKPHRMATATASVCVALLTPIAGLDWNPLAIGLWLIMLGAAFTAVRRGRRLVIALKSQIAKMD